MTEQRDWPLPMSISIGLSQGEYLALVDRANEARMNPASYIHALVVEDLTTPPQPPLTEDRVREIVTEMTGAV